MPDVKRKVCLSWDRERLGVVSREGPEVSEIKFDDGKTSYHPNRFIISPRPKLRERLQPSSSD